MARGGFRPGAGRKPGSKKSAEISEETQQIRDMLALKTKAKAKLYNDILGKIKSGGNVTLADKKLFDILSIELSEEANGGKPADETSSVDAKLFLEGLLTNPNVDQKTKIQIANILIPYQHARKGEGAGGKKEEQADRAKQAGAGRFQSGKPPIALVK
jgi:hypothetical protein